MPPEPQKNAAFDAIAADYDASFTDTAVGSAQRDRVWHFLTQALAGRPNSKVLECNCGTGADALWLAGQGCQVLATDVAPQMVAVIQAKTQQAGLKDRIETTVCSMQGIGTNPFINRSAPFDLMLSNFGGLNCLSPDEIRQFNTNLQTVMAPGAVLALVVMSRFSWWETLYFLLNGKPRTAFRRLRQGPVIARLDAETTIPTWYYAPKELSRLLPGFQIKRCCPVGFWLPPSYLDPFFRYRPRWLKALQWLEKKSAAAWLAPAADHYFLLLERKSVNGAD